MLKVDIDLLYCPNTSWLNTTCIRVVIFLFITLIPTGVGATCETVTDYKASCH